MCSDPEFLSEKKRNITALGADAQARATALDFFVRTAPNRYTYNFSWMGRPIIQLPQDIVAMQELIWTVRPDVIIETGVARGGSLVFYASMLELCGIDGEVIGIDIDIREHNRHALDAHPMRKRIHLIEGSSIDQQVIHQVSLRVAHKLRPLVVLDSNHTSEHVLAELRAYSPLVTRGSYLVVFDTIVESMPSGFFHDRPWDVGNNPATAVSTFLRESNRFVVDTGIDSKLVMSVAPGGYLKCVKD